MKILKILMLVILASSSFADISCSNTSGYSVSVDSSKSVELTTPYGQMTIGSVNGGGTYFYGNVDSQTIRSFSLSVKGNGSRLIIIRKNATPTMDRQNLTCSGTIN